MSIREYIHLLIRILILVLMILASCWTIINGESPVRIAFAVGFTIASISELFHYLLRWRKRVQAVLTSFEAGDPTGVPVDDDQLTASLAKISQMIRTEKSTGEVNQIYLDLLVRHLEIAVLCVDEEDKVILANDAFYQLADSADTKRLSRSFWNHHWMAQIIRSADHRLNSKLVTGRNKEYAVRRTSFILKNRSYRLFTFADIDSELKRKEQRAWKELLSILTHEIMNSIAPVSSLSQSLEERMTQTEESLVPEDWLKAVQAIRNRSENLLRFSEDYRRLSRLPDPQIKEVHLPSLFQRLKRLMLAKYPGLIITSGLDATKLHADEAMLEQVLVNLLKNAAEAGGADTHVAIHLSSMTVNQDIHLLVSDNGSGIPQDLQSKIFQPFYSTKEKGSGIGLSLCRQILLAHGGNITVISDHGQTVFTLIFPDQSLFAS